MKKLKIAIYAIAKNEIKFVDKWYNNVKEADYICVLDTGSTDGTYERLKELGCIVEQKIITPWRFDVARNESMKLIPKDADICVSTDFDELLDVGWAKTIKDNWVAGKTLQGIYTYVWKYNEDGTPAHVFQYGKTTSNDGKWYWQYPVHEDLARKGNEVYGEDACCNLVGKLTLHHYPDPEKPRSSYTELLEMRINEDPDDISRIYLAIDYNSKGKYNEAIELTKTVVSHEGEKGDGTLRNITEKAYCAYSTGLDYYFLKDVDNAMKYFNMAIDIDQTFRDSYIDMARLLIEYKCFNEAEKCLKNCIEKSVRHIIWIESNNSWGAVPYMLLSICCANQGKMFEAKMYINEAKSIEPDNPEIENISKAINA